MRAPNRRLKLSCLTLAITLSACTSLPDEPLEEGPDIRFPDMNRGQLTLRVRRLDRTESIIFEGRRLDFLGSPWEREFKLDVNLDGEFRLEVRRER